MKKVLAGLVILALPLFFSGATAAARELGLESPVPIVKSPSFLSLQLTTVMDLPLDESFPVFEVGAGLMAGMEYRLPSLPWLYVRGSVGYCNEAANLVPSSVSVFTAAAGIGLRVDLLPWLSAAVGVWGGGFGCLLDDPAVFGVHALVSADAGLLLLPGPWRLTLGASYRYLLNFYSGLSATLGLSYELPSTRPGGEAWKR
jgi:hypothetical protein